MKLDIFSPVQVIEKNEINNMRRELGLSPILMGFKNCLKCERQFFSEDRKNNHICQNCSAGYNVSEKTGRARRKVKDV